MSRTLKGNLTGRAARTERLDLMEEIDKKRLRFAVEWSNSLELLKKLDPNWEVWYDAQPEQTAGAMFPVIKRRIEEILKDVREKESDQRSEIQQMRHPY